MQEYDGKGTYSRDIHHTGVSLCQQASLTSASLHCERFIKYEWHHSKLPVNHNNPFGCWVSRDYDKMTSWGGASENGECATKRVKRPGGALGYFLGGYVPPGTLNWHPVLKKISPKIDTPF